MYRLQFGTDDCGVGLKGRCLRGAVHRRQPAGCLSGAQVWTAEGNPGQGGLE